MPLRMPTKKKSLALQLQCSSTTRDMFDAVLQNLKGQINRKYEDYLDIAKGMGHLESGSGDIQQQLDVKRIERIDEELMRLENDQLKAEIGAAQTKT